MKHIELILRPILSQIEANYKVYNQMKKINRSIDGLEKFFYQKGYDSLFTITGNGTNKPGILLKDFMEVAAREPMLELLPLKIHTITALPNECGVYKRCVFNINYNSRLGVYIASAEFQKVEMHSGKTLLSVPIELKNRKDLPSKSELNKIEIHKPGKKQKRKARLKAG